MTQIEIQTMNAVQSVNRKMRNQNETDWEQRRYEIAKGILPYCAETTRELLMRGIPLGDEYKDLNMPQAVAKHSVMFADALIQELRKGR